MAKRTRPDCFAHAVPAILGGLISHLPRLPQSRPCAEVNMHLRTAQNSLPIRPAAILLAVAYALVIAPCTDRLIAAERVSFRHDVMAVLSKAGCNQGTCHGNQNGKNGFKLSLRGEDDRFDHRALVRDQLGRRLNELDPDASLLLLKAIGRVPHGGGRRFDVDSLEYRTLAIGSPRGITMTRPTRHG